MSAAEAIDLPGRQVPAIDRVSREIHQRTNSWVAVSAVWELILANARPSQHANFRNGHVPPAVVEQAIAEYHEALAQGAA